MKSQTFYQALSILLVVILVLLALCLVAGGVLAIVTLTRDTQEPPSPPETQPPVTTTAPSQPVVSDPSLLWLGETADAGISYQDSLIFFGESTTAHLRSRGVLTGGTGTHQVWADDSGTRMLSSQITSLPIKYPETGEALTVAAACERAKPKYVVLSFGLNGISGFIANKSSYVNNYVKLIRAIQTASPDTKILLQTVYPVSNADSFSVDLETLNQQIQTLNSWLPEIAAAQENVRVVDTASVLRSSDGKLADLYNSGDGIHLTADAYRAVLTYLRTHAWGGDDE